MPDEVHELLEWPLLAAAIRRTKRVEADPSAVGGHGAEQIFEAAVRVEERKAFHVEEHVAVGWRRQQAKSVFIAGRKQVVPMLSGPAKADLQRRLMSQPVERRRPDARCELRVNCQVGARVHAGVVQPVDLTSSNAG